MKWISLLALITVLMIATVGCDKEPNPVISMDSMFSAAGAVTTFVLPAGATLQSATFYVYVADPSGQDVDIHRITSSWDEMTVTWTNFAGAYDAADEATFLADAADWRSTDITSLVQSWLDGTYMNYGLLMDQDIIDYPRTIYYSRDAGTNHPYMTVCYTDGSGTTCEDVLVSYDSYISEYMPDDNYGATEALFTGWAAENNLEKQALVWFDLEVSPPEEGCTRTIGYWKTHAGFGPQDDMVSAHLPIWLGTAGGAKSLEVIDAAMAVDVLKMATYGKRSNGITKLYAQLLGAKLNMASGASTTVISAALIAADAYLADHDWNDWSGLSKSEQGMILDWKDAFDDYNNGFTGPDHCE